jgi:hypothetical protein
MEVVGSIDYRIKVDPWEKIKILVEPIGLDSI